MQASILAFMTLGVILWLTLGKFQPLLLLLLCAMIAMVAAGMRGGRAAGIGARFTPAQLLSVAAFFGVGMLALQPQLIYAEEVIPYYTLRALLGLLTLWTGVGLVQATSDPEGERGTRMLIAGTLTLLFVQALVVFASPHPLIDVFVTNSAGVDFVLQGNNPYAMTYPDVYRGAYDFIPGFGYPPGALWLLVPFRLLGDVRLASIGANVASVVLLLWLMRRAGHSTRTGWIACLAWLALPISLFVLEQAWVDPILVPFILGLMLAVSTRRWVAAGALLAALIGIKQYAVLLVLPSAVFAWRLGGRAALFRATGATAIVLVLLIAPFALLDGDALYHQLAGTLFQRELRNDSLSIPAFIINALGRELPGAFLAAVTVASAIGFSAWLARKEHVDEHDWLSAIVMTFAITFLFGKQAFCNYYYLLAALLFARALVAPIEPAGRTS
ncbi:MAG: DUF2029 domain-containing protein [Deltaproteobacteria bacterium]|nr:DUF2029 domain-containing protein [Deltaproteobacteria bacterium]